MKVVTLEWAESAAPSFILKTVDFRENEGWGKGKREKRTHT